MTRPKGAVGRTLRALEARDPARERLRKLVSVTAGILGSLLLGYGVIHFLHADSGMLTISVFLSMMAGLFVKDPTARGRVVTTGLLVPAAALVPLVAVSLASERLLQLALFVLISGIATWVRRFGTRATTIGTLSFFLFFFTLLMRPTMAELPAFCLIAAGAVASQFIVQLILWGLRHPERELGVLISELRVASASAIDAATPPVRQRTLQARLARVDAMWHAIASWQQSFRTANYTDWDHESLAVRVLDACVNTQQACLELARSAETSHPGTADLELALSHALAALDGRSSPTRLEQSRSWAERVVDERNPSEDGACVYRLAECILAHTRLRMVSLHGRPPAGEHAAPSPATDGHPHAPGDHWPAPDAHHPDAASGGRLGRWKPSRWRPKEWQWTPWREWTPTTRLAVQAMAATAIASAAGEAISASRWYWAVLTAFLVFVSTTTRSGILTRAYRRIIGTVLGLIVGIGVTFLAHDIKIVLLAICLLSIMGMIYFGPVNYMYVSFFVTVLLVALYAVLGVLDGHLLEVRLEETVAGAAIGVLCAYLLLSATSRPTLIEKVDAYFDAVDALLHEASDVVASPDRGTAMLDKVHAVETAQADLNETISAMSTAFLIVGRDRVELAINLIHRASRSSVRFAQTIMIGAADPAAAAGLAREHTVVHDAISHARDAARQARGQLDKTKHPPGTKRDERAALPAAPRSSNGGDETVATALVALDRFTWVMRQLDDALAPSADRPARRARSHAL